jgi:hypothetical protein
MRDLTTKAGIYISISTLTLYYFAKNKNQQRLVLSYTIVMSLFAIGSYLIIVISMKALLIEASAGTSKASLAANLMSAPGSNITSMCTPINTAANVFLAVQYLLSHALMVSTNALHLSVSLSENTTQVYRVYVLFRNRWQFIAAPVLLWLGFLGMLLHFLRFDRLVT